MDGGLSVRVGGSEEGEYKLSAVVEDVANLDPPANHQAKAVHRCKMMISVIHRGSSRCGPLSMLQSLGHSR